MQIRHQRTLRQLQMPLSHHGCQASVSSFVKSVLRTPSSSIDGSRSTGRRPSIRCAAKKRRVAQSPVEAPPEEDVVVQVRVRNAQ